MFCGNIDGGMTGATTQRRKRHRAIDRRRDRTSHHIASTRAESRVADVPLQRGREVGYGRNREIVKSPRIVPERRRKAPNFTVFSPKKAAD
jgi:hypothetical protein